MLDLYCERTSSAFWSEPVNGLTNAAFLIAAAAFFITARRSRPYPRQLLVPGGFLVAIGIGSFLFHTLATPWSAALDVLPILAFIMSYLVVFLNLFLRVPWRWAWLGAPGFVAFTTLVAFVARGGNGTYLSALALLVGFGVGLWFVPSLRRYSLPVAGTGALFGISLAFRTIDESVCSSFPLGTHFVWHLLNATVLFAVLAIGLRRWNDLNSPENVSRNTRFTTVA